ncbi:urease accessory protein UreE [bacterium SCN 62-11]|nr:urease accessory protein UreE [Candidatus Eremiobacteraeota bacterium]ODT57236.1 MAG: urease accessory protein UreE [bacterium SCN 62-11]
MQILETILGNTSEAQFQNLPVDYLVLDQWEAQKSRFRKHTEKGTEVAVSLTRGIFLRDGDVLHQSEEGLIVAHIHLKEVLRIDLSELLGKGPELMVRTAVELGHALGNQHWPAVVKGSQVFVPLAVDRKVMASVMKTHALEGITYDFVAGSEVIPYLAPHESRRLFGAAEQALHDHSHAH